MVLLMQNGQACSLGLSQASVGIITRMHRDSAMTRRQAHWLRRLTDEALDSEGIHVDVMGQSQLQSGVSACFERFDGYCFHVTTAGAGCFTFPDARCPALPGDVVLFRPGDRIRFGNTQEVHAWSYTFVSITGGGVEQTLAALGLLQKRESWHIPIDDPWWSWLERVCVQAMTWRIRACAPAAIAWTFLDRLHAATRADDARARLDELVRSCLRLFEERLDEGVGVSEIARCLGVDRSTIYRGFREILQLSPVDVLQRLRLERACQLLRATSHSVAEVGRRCGFHDSSYFVRRFRDGVGSTPHRWRQSAQAIVA